MAHRRPVRACLLAAITLALTAACSGSTVRGRPATPTITVVAPSSPASSSAQPSASHSSARTSAHSSVPPPTSRAATQAAPPPAITVPVGVPPGTGPIIVIDPGHSVSVHGTDPATGLDVSDYENDPEMHDVFAVAELVRQKLAAVGYRVVLTKATLDSPTTLLQRAQLANSVHAALAVSIHDQAGANGGIPFASGNNIVYYQSVGDYRVTPSGHKVTFTDSAVAAVSERYGQLIQAARAQAEGHPVTLMGNTGYDLATRGLQAGNIWIVQLLSQVPWIYDEAGGNSAGQVGLNAADEQHYADGLVAGIERCVPVR